MGVGEWVLGAAVGVGEMLLGCGVVSSWGCGGEGGRWGFWGRTALQNGSSSHKLGNVPAN